MRTSPCISTKFLLHAHPLFHNTYLEKQQVAAAAPTTTTTSTSKQQRNIYRRQNTQQPTTHTQTHGLALSSLSSSPPLRNHCAEHYSEHYSKHSRRYISFTSLSFTFALSPPLYLHTFFLERKLRRDIVFLSLRQLADTSFHMFFRSNKSSNGLSKEKRLREGEISSTALRDLGLLSPTRLQPQSPSWRNDYDRPTYSSAGRSTTSFTGSSIYPEKSKATSFVRIFT